jgi:hypothetical protein
MIFTGYVVIVANPSSRAATSGCPPLCIPTCNTIPICPFNMVAQISTGWYENKLQLQLALAFPFKESYRGVFDLEEPLASDRGIICHEAIQVAFTIVLVLRREKMWLSMIVSDFRVFEGADAFDFHMSVFVQYGVAVFLDTTREVLVGGNGARDAVLSLTALDQMGFSGMNGSSACP